ncbi:MAG: hypothetical protein L3J12_09375 [Spirochaetales bacterium]|nr:hypothetical protein [Spirochaetales bacterium]
MKKIVVLSLFIILISAGSLFALESSTYFNLAGAYYFDDNKGYTINSGLAPVSYLPVPIPGTSSLPAGDEGRSLGNGWGGAEVKASIIHKMKVPFMQGEDSMTEGNNVLFQMKGEFSPVSINAAASATITPIAFLNFQLGTSIGTGWNFFGLFNGLGLNTNGTGIPEETPLPGIVSKSWISGTFQFDLGAVIPGEWTHIIMAVTAKMDYKYFSGAKKGEAWQFEADAGENFNGFSYLGSYVLGYKLPFMVNTVAFLVETSQMLGTNAKISSSDLVDWGSGFVQVTFGPLANIQLSKNSSLLVLLQFRTEKEFSKTTIFNNYFRNREQTGTYIDFRRIAVSYTRKF